MHNRERIAQQIEISMITLDGACCTNVSEQNTWITNAPSCIVSYFKITFQRVEWVHWALMCTIYGN